MTAVHWTSKLDDIAVNQLPFAIAQALNDTAKQAADNARTAAAKGMNIRKANVLRAFIRAPNDERATKQRHRARVMVSGPKSDPQRGSILTQHEESGRKSPFRSVAVAKPSRNIVQQSGRRVIEPGMELRNLKPSKRRTQKPDGKAIPWRKGTFVVTSKKTGLPIVLQRVGTKNVRVVWLYVRSTKLTPSLGFGKAVVGTVRRDLDGNIGRRLTQAIASARAVVKGGGVASSRVPG